MAKSKDREPGAGHTRLCAKRPGTGIRSQSFAGRGTGRTAKWFCECKVMRMKCVLIAPYEDLLELAESLKRERGWDLEVALGDLYQGVELARQYEQEGARVIISRGGTYQLIRRAVSIPVVEIKVSPEDLVEEFLQARAGRKRLALAGFRNVIEKSYNTLAPLSDSPIGYIPYDDPASVRAVLTEAANRGIDVFLTDAVGGRTALELGLDQRLIKSGREAVVEAVELAMMLAGERSLAAGDLRKSFGPLGYSVRPRPGVPGAKYTFADIVYASEDMRKVIENAKIAATSDLPVLITGETGTGKELLAHSIHSFSRRRNGPFVVIPCGAVPGDLFVSETMGYSEGAFTGAARGGRTGLLESADGGTLFLDEVQDLPLEAQGVLLRFLQEGECRRLGDNRTRKLDVRVIAASNQDLPELVRREKFRKDLYYRLNVFCIAIPPLRARREDVPVLADHFLRVHAPKSGKAVSGFEPGAYALLRNYGFPGNVRELESLVLRAVAECEGSSVTEEHIAALLSEIAETESALLNRDAGEPQSRGAGTEVKPEGRAEIQSVTPLRIMERELIDRALSLTSGNMALAAKMLGISRSTLWRKVKNYYGPAPGRSGCGSPHAFS